MNDKNVVCRIKNQIKLLLKPSFAHTFLYKAFAVNLIRDIIVSPRFQMGKIKIYCDYNQSIRLLILYLLTDRKSVV